jgi:hypothetical protein
MLCFMNTLPLLMTLAATAMVLLELISKNAGEAMNAVCRDSWNGIGLAAS